MNTNKTPLSKPQFGLTLIELLVAMVIGVFIIGGISQVFIATKHSNKILMAETELQENARFAFSVITNIVRKAGNLGCKAPSETNTTSLLDFNEGTFRPWMAIEGWEANNTSYGTNYTPAVTAQTLVTPNSHWSSISNTVLDDGISSVPNSDILKIWHTADKSGALSVVTDDTLNFSTIDIEQGDIVVLNDCKSVTFLQACNCDTSDGPACSGNDQRIDISPSACNTPGNKVFNSADINVATADVQVLEQSVFVIGKRDQNQSDIASLFIYKLSHDGKLGEREEILEGLESMQIQYGEDTNNNNSPNYYVNAHQVGNWKHVVSIRMSLLMRSFKNNLLAEPQNINFNGAKVSIPNNDRYLRRVYSSTIALRNRNIGY
ncbi:MAG: PilW family protein [Leucothrix sp.]